MVAIRYTRNLFLRSTCVIYLFAFISFYIQIPGLYGDNGILPAKSVLENNKYKSWSAKVHYQPTLLWLAPFLGLDTQYALDVLSLLGAFLAFTGFVSQKFCTIPLFAGLWSLYFSLYQVGQVFVSSQWDTLLLETGFLCILVAPLLPGRRRGSKGSPSDTLTFWLVKWLLFRFLVSPGIVKLLSNNPNWWNLNALSYHFQYMPLPTPLSWYAHQLPQWSLRLTTVFVNVCELALPFLFFLPVRSVRLSSFIIQIFLQLCIIATGNFNFLNLLVIVLLLSLLDDQVFSSRPRKHSSSTWSSGLGHVLNVLIHVAIVYGVVVLYQLKLDGTQISASIGFTKDAFVYAVKNALPISVYVGLASLGLTVSRALSTSVLDASGVGTKVRLTVVTLFYSALAAVIFFSSTVPLLSLHPVSNATVAPSVRTLYNRLSKLHIVNEHGRLAAMPKEKRLELVLEGSDNIEGPWQEYNFLYKPGNVNHSLPCVAPYSPRLDWQLWFAAQRNSYRDEPWVLSLAHRLLLGRPEVLALLNKGHSPFQKVPPKYVRGVLYEYQFTAWVKRWQPTWWQRTKVTEYFPAFTKDSPALVDFLKARNLLPIAGKPTVNSVWKQILDSIRYVTSHLEATLLTWSVFTAGCAIITTSA